MQLITSLDLDQVRLISSHPVAGAIGRRARKGTLRKAVDYQGLCGNRASQMSTTLTFRSVAAILKTG